MVQACIILLIHCRARGIKHLSFDTAITQGGLTDDVISHDMALVLVLHGNESF